MYTVLFQNADVAKIGLPTLKRSSAIESP